jgi:hypothetical protein
MKLIRIGVLGMLLAACAAPQPTRPPSAPAHPSDFPAAFYREAAAAGRAVYQINPTRSLGTVYAYRRGSLAKLGHDHVIASHAIQGYGLVGRDTKDARADLYVPLASLVIDEPALRRSAGFEGQLRADEVAATRVHMLESVLQAGRYPFLQLHADWAKHGRDKVLKVTIRLHGITRSYRVPVRYSRSRDSLTASGQIRIRQTDFGMTPYSVLGGALGVKDELRLRFSIVATPIGGGRNPLMTFASPAQGCNACQQADTDGARGSAEKGASAPPRSMHHGGGEVLVLYSLASIPMTIRPVPTMNRVLSSKPTIL